MTLTSGTGPSGVQWTLTYSNTQVASITATAGSAATGAGKTLSCTGGAGSYKCLATGMNATAIPNGTVAVANVTLAAGVSSANIGVSATSGVLPDGTGMAVTGAGGTITGQTQVISNLSGLSCSPSSITTPGSSTCTVSLTGAAPASGAVVALSENSASLTAPASVTVPAGASTATFTANASSVTSSTSAVITATYNGISQSATLSLLAPAAPPATISLSSLQCNPATLASGASSTCTVTLSGAAPSGGTAVAISDNSAALTVPGSVTVPASQSSATFTATAGSVTATQTAVVTATLSGVSKTASITITDPPPPVSDATYTIFSPGTTPNTITDSDGESVELGMKFMSSVPGYVTGVRFYKGPYNKGTHVGHLWTKNGTLLAKVSFGGETATGWQQANFSNPVAISADTIYVVSYRAPFGHYADDQWALGASITNGPLKALADGESGPNGVYRYGTNLFPNLGWNSSNYYVDVVFKPNSGSVTSKNKHGNPAVAEASNASLSCSPRAVSAGSSFTCELQFENGSEAAEFAVDASSANVMLPAAVTARASQHSLTFQGSVNDGAPQETITISATAGGQTVEDTISAVPASDASIHVPPDQLVAPGAAVDFKVTASTKLSAAGLPAGASFDAESGRFQWTPTAEQQGGYDVQFAANGSSSAKTVHIEVTPGMPVITSTQLACSPGAIASLSGKWLGDRDAAADASGNSAELSGTRVRVNGAYVPVLFSSQTEARFVCPAGAAGDALEVVLETPSGATDAIRTTMRSAAPALLSMEDTSQGLVFVADTAKLASVRQARTGGLPAQPGDLLSIRATGISSDLPLFVKIGDAPAEVVSIAPSADEAGVWEIQVKVPSSAAFGDAVPVQLQVAAPEGTLDSNTVSIALEDVRP